MASAPKQRPPGGGDAAKARPTTAAAVRPGAVGDAKPRPFSASQVANTAHFKDAGGTKSSAAKSGMAAIPAKPAGSGGGGVPSFMQPLRRAGSGL